MIDSERGLALAEGFVRSLAFLALVAGLALTARAEEPTNEPAAAKSAVVDKSHYTLFNPTPASQMRDFVSDRPSVTESPFTVDAGHLQVEASFAEYTHDDDHGTRSDGFSVLPTDFRLGILEDVDLELVINPYETIRTHGNVPSQRDSGFGDVEVRSTVNLWGNDGDGKTAFGLIPFVSFPTGAGGVSEDHVEGGLILPLDVKLPHAFDLGTEIEFDVSHNDEAGGYGLDFVHTMSLGHSLFTDRLGAYIEYAGVAPWRTGNTYLGFFDTGVTYLLRENLQLDAAIDIGLTDHADDVVVLTGLSFRL